jgi:hypothetical protein
VIAATVIATKWRTVMDYSVVGPKAPRRVREIRVPDASGYRPRGGIGSVCHIHIACIPAIIDLYRAVPARAQISRQTMIQTRKLRVGIVFGGQFAEHEISILSARNVLAALDLAL